MSNFVSIIAGQRILFVRGVSYRLPCHPIKGDGQALPQQLARIGGSLSTISSGARQIAAETLDLLRGGHAGAELFHFPRRPSSYIGDVSSNEALNSHSGSLAGRAALRQETDATGFFGSNASTFNASYTTKGCVEWCDAKRIGK